MRTRSVAALALALWWLAVNSCLLASTNKTFRIMGRVRETMENKVDHKPRWRCSHRRVKMTTGVKKALSRTAVFWYFGVVFASASVLAVILALGDLWSKRGELTFALGSAQLRITCGGGADRDDSKTRASMKSHYVVATSLAFASLLSAAMLLGYADAARSFHYKIKDCLKHRIALRKKLCGFLVFGVVAVVLSAVAFLVYFARLFRAHFKVALGQWLIQRVELISHDLSKYLADDDNDDHGDLEQEGLMADARSEQEDDKPEEGGAPSTRTKAQCLV